MAKRVLTCSFLALLSGFFASYVGGQIAVSIHTQKCQNQPWGVQQMCHAWETPGAIWQGSTTGLWTGTVLGAFFSGLMTRRE
ncbi:hypothetical protein [Iningainema tapete]|uniref:Uncharacterized protein n=1 Tax=Iningainema tapete BLCC-T55 TaxID=2748662 RepID=A0A8J6XR11_9CYAN|nr:hypothetical protein [Iningainema tapete]MBD2777656.1 hypothetical protein [Iningainema tapete BLCC-T55]